MPSSLFATLALPSVACTRKLNKPFVVGCPEMRPLALKPKPGGGLAEPEGARHIEHRTLVRDVGDDAIERGMTVGRHQDQLVGLEVDVAHLARLEGAEIVKMGFAENVHVGPSWNRRAQPRYPRARGQKNASPRRVFLR